MLFDIFFKISKMKRRKFFFNFNNDIVKNVTFFLKSRVEILFNLTHKLIKMKIIKYKINYLNIVKL